MQDNIRKRPKWGSRFGFILAAAGSAIGLGNIWRFPTVTAANGGAVFLIVYIALVVLIGIPVMLSELVIGRASEKNPVGAFRMLGGKYWKYVGLLGVITGMGILSYYAVVAGWTLFYFVSSMGSGFAAGVDTTKIFTGLISSAPLNTLLLAIFLFLNVIIILGGVKNGIEKASKILMPLMLLLLVALVIRSITLPHAGEGLSFYLNPDFSKLSPKLVLAAISQAFFSLSLGMGAILTYGSYLNKKVNLVSSSFYIAGFDVLIAFLAGLAILPALFSAGLKPGDGGAGMIFIVLPELFSKLPGGQIAGNIFGTAFFLLLAVAALTSSVSLMEVVVSYLVDEKKWSRKKSAISVGIFAFILGIPSVLSNGANKFFSDLPVIKQGFLDFMDHVFGNYSLTIGAFLLVIFIGWFWGTDKMTNEIRQGNPNFRHGDLLKFLVKILAPVAILVVFVSFFIAK